MREENRQARMAEIEAVAYGLFAEKGFEGTSMLAVARAAKASNETLYRWYGDRNGLFESMVRRNAAEVVARLDQAMDRQAPAMEVLEELAPVLLAMLLSDHAILLNRAAASDPGGALGRLLAQSGREAVLPRIERLLGEAIEQGALHPPEEGGLGALFIHLLVGDRQIRRVIGVMPEPGEAEVWRQARWALRQLQNLCGGDVR